MTATHDSGVRLLAPEVIRNRLSLGLTASVLVRPGVTVIRDGRRRRIDPTEVLLGDLLVAAAGDQIAGDGTVVGNRSADVHADYLVLAFVAATWAVVLRAIWRRRLLERLLGTAPRPRGT